MGGNHPRLRTKEQHQMDDGFKKNPYTHGLNLYLLMILVILLQTTRALVRFWITAGQSSSTADNVLLGLYQEYTYVATPPHILRNHDAPFHES